MKTAFVIRNPFTILCARLSAYREDKLREKDRRVDARRNRRLAMYTRRHMYDDSFEKEDIEDGVQVATTAINFYEEMLMLDRANEVFGTGTIFGKALWFIALVFAELVGVLLGLAAVSGIFGDSVLYAPTVYWVGALVLLAVGIPTTILAINGKILAPLLKLRIRRLRACRDELNEVC